MTRQSGDNFLVKGKKNYQLSSSVWFMKKAEGPSWPAEPGAEWSRGLVRLRSVGWSRGGRVSQPATKGRERILDLFDT